ncbi:MAG: hypothetical protein ABJD07_13090 [Gemmatimonadaceae bacterium]
MKTDRGLWMADRVLASFCCRALALAALTLSGAACSTGGVTGVGPATGAVPVPALGGWTVQRREHADAWLHAFAITDIDTTIVPYFRRGYRAQMQGLKARGNVLSQLDVNRDRLLQGLRSNPNYTSAQFFPLYFENWTQFNQAIDVFLQANGNPRSAGDQQTAQMLALFAGVFQTSADRDWLQLFVNGVRDEYTKFYDGYWQTQQRERASVTTRVGTLWNDTYYPKFRRYLNSTQLGVGQFVLSLPLDGEGRTITGSRQTNTIAVEFPDRESDALNAIYVFAHEASSPVVNPAIADNVTPAQKRDHLDDAFTSAGAVQGGAMLIKRVAPELLDGYVRFYLASANRTASAGTDPMAQLQAVFPLPQGIRDAIGKQLDNVLGGI